MDTVKKQKILKYSVAYTVMALIAFLTYYIALPPMNPQSKAFWGYLLFLSLLGALPLLLLGNGTKTLVERIKAGNHVRLKTKSAYHVPMKKSHLLPLLPAALMLFVLIVGSIFSSAVFNARSYADVISVTEGNFSDDMPETERITNIALMDTDTARIIGSRTLGSLSHVVSQYEVSDTYNQINYQRTPKKVSNLEYAGFFKWIGNRANGIPGYVMVDPVNNTATYQELDKALRYVQSGFFGDDLMRKLRFSYPTKILGEPRFEVNDEGDPMFVVPCYRPRVLIFGAEDVSEVILFNPVNGESEIYAVAETPAWIDGVYDGYLACEKYDWKGLLSGGYINSIIGNKDCKQTTDDFGYVVIEDDVWYYTGVTSVNSDKSNIGFILSNARTGEYKFFPVIGAEEHSAMAAAEGEVQEKEYIASFPALVNISGRATYIMVLKDAGGLVKLYALVNVEKYSIVATGTTQEEAMADYKQLLLQEGMIDEGALPAPAPTLTADLAVSDLRIITTGGESLLYITADYNERACVFKMRVADDEALMLIAVGDTLCASFKETETERIYQLTDWEFGS
ncbi:MAG: hypothetical protein E7663_03450 [Ruminococcaceae bacterium]|nr:hypothetical protein [Oscillospiraceae bacterium]